MPNQGEDKVLYYPLNPRLWVPNGMMQQLIKDMHMECSLWNCKKRAIFFTTREDKEGERAFCEEHMKEKMGKYILKIRRI